MRRTFLSAALAALVMTAGAQTAFAAAAPPIIEAVRKGDAATVRLLLKQPAGVKATLPDGTTALHWAVHRDDLAITDLLIKAGADVKAANKFGATPLSMACVNGN